MSSTYIENERIRSALQCVPADNRDQWVRILMAIKSELGDAGQDIADAWSQTAETFKSKDFRDVWKGINTGGGVTIATLFHVAHEHGWRDDQPHVMPTAEQGGAHKAEAAKRAELERIEKVKKNSQAALKAALIWDKATPVQPEHPYLERKVVKAVPALKELQADELKALAGYAPSSKHGVLIGRILIAQITVNGQLSGLEFIDQDGRKSALAGSVKSGGYAPLQATPEGNGEGLTLLIGEGLASCMTAKQATGYAAFAALSSGNLLAVAKELCSNYPQADVVILGELLKANGEVDPHAIQAVEAIGARLAVPDFGIDRHQEQTDINDYATKFGVHAVQKLIQRATQAQAASLKTSPAANAWPEPQPLHAKIEPEPYPLDALPEHVLAAVEEVRAFVQAPAAMVATCALSALSLAIQAQVDVERAEKLSGPVGLFSLVIAESGDRKSSCDGYFTAPIRDFEQKQFDDAKPLVKEYNGALHAWEAKQAGVKAQVSHLAKTGKPTRELEQTLCLLEQERPEPPRVPRLTYVDATPEALCWALRRWPSGGVLSSEAGSVLGSHGMGNDSAMRNLATLNQLWGGETVTIDRKTSESFRLRGARFTIGLQIQEPTLRAFLVKSGALARGSGFLARFLIAWPESTQGARPFAEPPAHWPHLEVFQKRLTVLLNLEAPIDDEGGLVPQRMTLTPSAKTAWIEFHDSIEKDLARGGELYDVRDVASKIADNVARLAALFHMFECGAGSVSLDALERASRIAAWHLSESKRFFGELAMPQDMADAARLDTWLIAEARASQGQTSTTRDAQRLGPVRDKARLDAALNILSELDRVRLGKVGKRNLIAVNPGLLRVTP